MGSTAEGHRRRPRALRLGLLVAVVALAWLAWGLRSTLAAWGVQSALGAAGYRLSYDGLSVDWGRLWARDVDIRSAAGEPVLGAVNLEVRFDPLGVFGGPHLYGIESVNLDHPRLTFIRHRDGSTNIWLPQSSGGSGGGPFAVPAIRIAVRDGSIGIVDDSRIFAHSRRIAIERVNVDAALDPRASSTWSGGLTVLDGDGRFPINGRGTLDDARGIELSRITAKSLGLSALLDYGLNSRSLHIANGVLYDVDVRLYGLRAHDGSIARHVAATAKLDHFQPYLNGVAKPLRDGRGAIRLYDDGVTFPKVDGSIAGVPVRIAGAIYDLTRPTLRLGIAGRGDLARLITLSDVAKKLPLGGPLAFKLLVEGDAVAPLTLATFSSPRLRYDRLRLDGPAASVALQASDATLIRSKVAYDGMRATARGDFILSTHTGVEMLATVDAPAAKLPYAQDVLGPMTLHALAVASGTDGDISSAGRIEGRSPRAQVTSTFSIDGRGRGTIGPFVIEGAHGQELLAHIALDGGRHASAVVSAERFTVALGAHQPALPGIFAPPSFPLRATLDGAAAVALAGGSGLAAVDMQAGTLRAFGASVHRVAARALLGTRPRALDVYGARLQLGGGNLTAQGSFGNGGRLVVTARDLEPASLGVPTSTLNGGRLGGVAIVRGTFANPDVTGGLALSNGTVADNALGSLGVDAHTDVHYHDGKLALGNGTLRAGPIVAAVSGAISGLRNDPRRATYRLEARTRNADIATLARIGHADREYPEGSLDADLTVTGSGSAPSIAGHVAIGEGSLNGLAFRDADVTLSGNPDHMVARGGRVTVGTSTVGFDADIANARQALSLHAPRLNLADFNDFFDQGDTLGGVGRIDLAVVAGPDALRTSGSVRLTHARLRRYDFGSTTADWSTHGTTISTRATLNAPGGALAERGSVRLAANDPLHDALHRSDVAVDIQAHGVDLAVWLPAAGIREPISGLVDADARVSGVYPALSVQAAATLHNGVARGIPIRTAEVALRAQEGRATISRALLAIDGLTASASGALALSPEGPFDLALTANTPDAAALAHTLTGKTYDAAGALSATAHLTGTSKTPRLLATLDATGARFVRYTLPHAHAQLSADRSRANLELAEVDLQRGRFTATGSVPLATRGIAWNEPMRAQLTADAVDLAQFAALFPQGTSASGTIAGNLGVDGTLDEPEFAGALSLAGGSFAGPQLRSRLTGVTARVALAGRTLELQDAAANVGGGTVKANGSVTVADLHAPAKSANVRAALVSSGAVFDVPNLFRGRLDGNLDIARAPDADMQASGKLDVSSARIPTVALLPKEQSGNSSAPAMPVDFNLKVGVGNDVRVQGGPVDIGAKGNLDLGGTLAAPAIAGRLTSTGGTLSFYRTFRVEYPSVVVFHRYNGVIPDVDARATTSIDNPPTDVALRATGPATQLNVDLQSDPSYSREQIVGLLLGAQSLGAVSGIASTTGPAVNPLRAAAEGQLGSLLAQNILEPFGSQLGNAIGLSNLELNYQPGGAYGLGAQKSIGKHLNAVFAESFNYPQRQSIGLLDNPNRATALQFTVFSQPQANRLRSLQPGDLESSNQSVTASEPANGATGFSISVQKKFH